MTGFRFYGSVLVLLAATVVRARSAVAGKVCQASGGGAGTCKLLGNCPALLEESFSLKPGELLYRHSGGCGRDRLGQVYLCCPQAPLTFPDATPKPQIEGKKCQASGGKPGTCKQISQCPTFLEESLTVAPGILLSRHSGGCGQDRPSGSSSFNVDVRYTGSDHVFLCCPDDIAPNPPSVATTDSACNPTPQICAPPFVSVGGKCLLFGPGSGSWSDMRRLCRQQGGDMLVFSSANLMADVLEYIRSNGLTGNSYWIGATDVEQEGNWKWVDGTPVRMGTPFWGFSFDSKIKQPDGGPNANCAELFSEDHFVMHDGGCDGYKSVICQK